MLIAENRTKHQFRLGGSIQGRELVSLERRGNPSHFQQCSGLLFGSSLMAAHKMRLSPFSCDFKLSSKLWRYGKEQRNYAGH